MKRPRGSEANSRAAVSKKPRPPQDHGALLAESLPALMSKAESCAEYLKLWSQQGTKGADGTTTKWKFEVRPFSAWFAADPISTYCWLQKNKQSWLIDNMYDNKMVHDAVFDLLEAYLAGLKGAQRARCLEISKGLVEDQIAAPLSSRDAYLKRYKAASPEAIAAAAKAAAAAELGAASEPAAEQPAASAEGEGSAVEAATAEGTTESDAPTAELPPDTRPPLPEGFDEVIPKKVVKARAQRIAALLA